MCLRIRGWIPFCEVSDLNEQLSGSGEWKENDRAQTFPLIVIQAHIMYCMILRGQKCLME